MHSLGITVHIYLWHTKNLNKWRWTLVRDGAMMSGENSKYSDSLDEINTLINDYEKERTKENSKQSSEESTQRVGERIRVPALT